MYLNNIDDLINKLIDDFYQYTLNNNIFEKIRKDNNFVKYQIDIFEYINEFIKTINKKDIINIIKNENYYNNIIYIINKYILFYIYLGIGYYYEGNLDLYIINLIELSKYQKDNNTNKFYTSENISKIIKYYTDIKYIIEFQKLENFDKIKIILSNNLEKYDSLIDLFNEIGEDFIINYFFIENNFNNIIKSIIYKIIYIKEDRFYLYEIINENIDKNVEYKYIEIVLANEKKLIDFNFLEKFVIDNKLNIKNTEDYYNFLLDIKKLYEFDIKNMNYYINYLFNNEIIIPITEEFIRYHKDIEKYSKDSENTGRDDTKIKYIINKINNVKNLYSNQIENNKDLKQEISDLFYKSLDPRMAVLYNDYEEIKIINKLKQSDTTQNINNLIDLENIRKYIYINFKNIKYGIKIRPDKTIQGIRYINFKYKNIKQPLELRIANNNIDINIRGIALNPSKNPLIFYKNTDLINVKDLKKNKNGFYCFTKIMKKMFNNKNNNKLYYWLFDENDKVKLDTYIDYNVNNIEKNIKIMLNDIYNIYSNLVINNLNMLINNVKNLSKYTFNNIFNNYKKNYLLFDIKNRNLIIENAMNKIKEIDLPIDDNDDIIFIKKSDIYKLPILKNKKKATMINDVYFNNVICNHNIKWINIMKLSKKSDEFTQAIFNYIKQYVKIDKSNNYICKSCGEEVQIKKYVYEGTYVEETDTFLTTSIAVNQKLENISKYSKYMRTIKNIEKNIEKLSSIININSYIGNTPIILLKRRMIIKDIIDLLLIHTNWLDIQDKNRKESYYKKYGINKNLSYLFFFELKDDIFLTSSTDTDKYKIIKYNNIIIYLIFIYILDLNSGQIINLKLDKKYNYFLYNKVKDNLFNNLFIRINFKEKVPLSKLPVLSYILYYISSQIIENRIWLYNTSNLKSKEKFVLFIEQQNIIIHTFIDLVNTIIEANFESNKNFLYEILNMRFINRLNNIFNNNNLLKNIENNSNINIIIDSSNQIKLKVTNIQYIDINYNENNLIELQVIPKKYYPKTIEYRKDKIKIEKFIFTELSICDVNDNNDIDLDVDIHIFHNWVFRSNDLYCTQCNKCFTELSKTKINDKINLFYLNKVKLFILNKLYKKYCVSGNLHTIVNNKCTLCNLDLKNYTIQNKNLYLLETNLEKIKDESVLLNINQMIEYNKINLKENNKINKKIKKILKKYKKNVNNNIELYIDKFLNKLINILGPKINLNNNIFYLKETMYILDHDQFGKKISNEIIILSSENLILSHYHPIINKTVLYYFNNKNKIYIFYNYISLQYLGYSDNINTITFVNKNVILKKILSLKENILLLGYDNEFINMIDFNKDFINNDTNKDKYNDFIINILRKRILNLKQIILRAQSIIHNIKNHGKIKSMFNLKENEIIKEFSKKIKLINITNTDSNKLKNKKNNIFLNYKYIIYNLNLNYNINNENINFIDNYVDSFTLNSLKNIDIINIYYLIYNFNKILDYNNIKIIKNEIAMLLINIIKYLFNLYYISNSNYYIRQFHYILINENPYINDELKVSGNYQELLSNKEIDDPDVKEKEYDAREEFDAFDIDDYDVDDDIDIDNAAEVFDGYDPEE